MHDHNRQLAAIMFTDIVGYTSLMGKDAAKALELVRISKEIQKPLVEKHKGKWLKEMGDGARLICEYYDTGASRDPTIRV